MNLILTPSPRIAPTLVALLTVPARSGQAAVEHGGDQRVLLLVGEDERRRDGAAQREFRRMLPDVRADTDR